MKYALIKDDVVVQIQGYKQEGFVEVIDSTVCGMLKTDNGFINPEPETKSIQDQIDDLENTVTKRNYREFVMGNQYSIDKINQVDAEIAILRTKI